MLDIWRMSHSNLSNQYSLFYTGLMALFLLSSCKKNDQDIPKDLPDVSVHTVHYDSLFFQSDATLEEIQSGHTLFTQVYLRNILGIPPSDSIRSLMQSSEELQTIQSDIDRTYPDKFSLDNQAEELFSFAKYYFPEALVPKVYFCNTLFNLGTFTVGDSIAAVGLDFFLGDDYEKYPNDIFPNYIKQNMQPTHWSSKLAEAWLNEQVDFPAPERMIDYAIYNGLILYLKKKLLPKTPDTVIFEYTEDQLNWLYDNESEIWSFLIQGDILYSRNLRDFQKLVNQSPSGINGMPAETPGRAGNFIGFRIVEAYVRRNATIEPKDLLALNSYDDFFQSSKYKPKIN